MVRGTAAVLGLLAAAPAYVLVAPALPVLGSSDLALFVAASVGVAAVIACIAAVVPVSDIPALAVLLAAGALLLVAALNAADAGAAATPVEAVAYGAVGTVFATGLLAPSLALALPLFVAGVDIASTLAGGPSELLAHAAAQAGDPLSLELPDWGTGLSAGRVGISDAVFAGVFLTYARRFGLRPRATAVGLALGAIAAVAIGTFADRSVPVIPFMVIGYFAVNADRLRALTRLAARG